MASCGVVSSLRNASHIRRASTAAPHPSALLHGATMRAIARRARPSLVSAVAAASTGPIAVFVSIYVNPGQFTPTDDLATYSSDFAGDLGKLAATGLYSRGSTRRPTNLSGNGEVSCLQEAGGDKSRDKTNGNYEFDFHVSGWH